jgi:hypothetical protein
MSGAGTVSSLTNDLSRAFSDVSTNVVLEGIAPGDYYVMAFIDANGNKRRDAWESWGYVCKVGTDASDKWTPVPTSVSSAKVDVQSRFLVIEDADVNQNWVPDCLRTWAPPPE